MSHREAERRVAECGGQVVDLPAETTDLLVVGEERWPLAADGRLTRSLETARALQDRGFQIAIASEEEFLASLGLRELHIGMHREYTTEQIARITGVGTNRIRRWTRCGLLRPTRVVRRLCWFDFRQLASVRALAALQDAGASAYQIEQSLRTLAHTVPGLDVPVTRLELLDDGRRIGLRLDDGRVAEPNGQLRFDFDLQPTQATVPVCSAFRKHSSEHRTADDWFDLGVAAEESGRLDTAVDCYMNALLAGGPQAETTFNLGNALYGLGQHAEASQRFLQSIEIDPDYVEAWNHLGNALAKLGRHDEAIRSYEQALELEPQYADAHCNLAESLEHVGKRKRAATHWRAYLALDPDSAWAQEIRRRLGDD